MAPNGILGPKYGKNRSQSPKYMENFQIYVNIQIALSIRFQRALNSFSIFLQTRVMPIFVFLGPKPQIRKFGPRPPNFLKLLKLIIHFDSSHRYTSNEPSTPFQSIRKLELCLFSCFGGQRPKYGNLAPDLQILKKIRFFDLDRFVSLTCF